MEKRKKFRTGEKKGKARMTNNIFSTRFLRK